MTQRRSVRVEPVTRPLRGSITLPGSKSITNRALLVAALAPGRSVISGALSSDDTRYMAEALRTLGVYVQQVSPSEYIVTGTGRLRAPAGQLFLGNAGTAMRFLTAAAALVPGTVVLQGDSHMQKRPIGPLVAALQSLGVAASDTGGRPPVTVHGTGGFAADRVEIDGTLSSQFVSAVLMAAAGGTKPLEIAVRQADIGGRGYIDITLAVMRAFGATVTSLGEAAWRVDASGYTARDYRVEPDASAATYLWAAEALTAGRIDLGADPAAMSQPDARAHAVIAQFPHMPGVINGEQMQDAVPTLAALAAFNATPVRFVGIANLRVKECDRINAMATELSRVRSGLAVEEGDDLIVHGDPALAGQTLPANVHTYADHRIAMAMSLVAMKVGGLRILDPDCVAKTYPLYWNALESLGIGLAFDA